MAERAADSFVMRYFIKISVSKIKINKQFRQDHGPKNSVSLVAHPTLTQLVQITARGAHFE
jgi:hypothetical protein